MRKKLIAFQTIAAAVLLVLSTGGLKLQNCIAEDSTNCYWDAATQGNAAGESFIDLSGTTIYIP